MGLYSDIFRASMDRISAKCPSGLEFFDKFYYSFIQKDDEVEEHFRSVKMSEQAYILKQALHEVVKFYEEQKPNEAMVKIARRHGISGLNIRPRLYSIWLATLIETAKEFDDQFDQDVELAWKMVLQPAITFVSHHFRTRWP